MRLRNVLAALLVTSSFSIAARSAQDPTELHLTIIEENAPIDNVRLRTNREPMVQVTDQNHRPVAGAAVSFALPSTGAGGAFKGGNLLKAVTNAKGIARATGFRPNAMPGTFEIHVTAAFHGQVGSAVISQTNMLAGGGAAVSSGGAAAGGANAAGTPGAAGSAAAGAATAAGVGGAAGISTGALVAIVGGVAAAGSVAAKVATGGGGGGNTTSPTIGSPENPIFGPAVTPAMVGNSARPVAAAWAGAARNSAFSRYPFGAPMRGSMAPLHAESRAPLSFWGRLAANRFAAVGVKHVSIRLRLEASHGIAIGPRHLATTGRAR